MIPDPPDRRISAYVLVLPDGTALSWHRIEETKAPPQLIAAYSAKGWIPLDENDYRLMPLQSMRADIHALRSTDNALTFWVHRATLNESAAVTLANRLDRKRLADVMGITDETANLFIPVMNPLPMPEWGTVGVIIHDANNATAIAITALPPAAQQLQQEIHQMILDTSLGYHVLWSYSPGEPSEELQQAVAAMAAKILEDVQAYNAMYQTIITKSRALAKMYYAYYVSNKGKQQIKLPHIPDAVKHRDDSGHGMLWVSFDMTPRAVMQATQNTGKWDARHVKGATPHHNLRGGNGVHQEDYVQTTVQVPPNKAIEKMELPQEKLAQELEGVLSGIGALEGDLILAVIAQRLAAKGELLPDGSFWIYPETFLDYRGIKPKTKTKDGIQRSAGVQAWAMDAVIKAFERTLYLHVDVNQTGKGKRKIITRSHLILELERKVQPTLMTEGKDQPLAYRIKLGTWFDEYNLNLSAHYGWVMQKVLNYDPEQQQYEKYLGRYFTFHLNIAAQAGQKTINRTIRTLLDGCGFDPDTRYPQKTTDRFHKAMNTLAADGVISAWEYRDTNTQEPPERKTKGWLDDWLDMNVLVTIASRIEEHGAGKMIDGIQAAKSLQIIAAPPTSPYGRRQGRPRKPTNTQGEKRPRGRPHKEV